MIFILTTANIKVKFWVYHGYPHAMHLEDLEAFGMIQKILKYVMEYTKW